MEKTYELLTPIEINGQDPICTLTFKEPDLNTLSELEKHRHNLVEATRFVISKTTGLEPGEVGRIKARDVKAIDEILKELMGESPKTGEV